MGDFQRCIPLSVCICPQTFFFIYFYPGVFADVSTGHFLSLDPQFTGLGSGITRMLHRNCYDRVRKTLRLIPTFHSIKTDNLIPANSTFCVTYAHVLTWKESTMLNLHRLWNYTRQHNKPTRLFFSLHMSPLPMYWSLNVSSTRSRVTSCQEFRLLA